MAQMKGMVIKMKIGVLTALFHDRDFETMISYLHSIGVGLWNLHRAVTPVNITSTPRNF